ncbi:hypothetical protein H311_03106 [Anncaliia algerae PRA109]|nr:hypothetical protein H311_03106 [Anncaliia algerae PRA109]
MRKKDSFAIYTADLERISNGNFIISDETGFNKPSRALMNIKQPKDFYCLCGQYIWD